MEKSEILEQITEIFKDTLDNDDIVLTYDTTANDVEDWDSLNHIQLVVAVEKRFKIRFASQEIQKWDTVGDMVNSVHAKLG
jgi:acyl carrier protein